MRLAHIFFDADLRRGHYGLAQDIKQKMGVKDVAIFINRAQNQVKMLVGHGDYVVHYHHPQGKIAEETIRHLPNCLEGPKLNYKKAQEIVIDEFFEKRGR